jgi:hypothetical protein
VGMSGILLVNMLRIIVAYIENKGLG